MRVWGGWGQHGSGGKVGPMYTITAHRHSALSQHNVHRHSTPSQHPHLREIALVAGLDLEADAAQLWPAANRRRLNPVNQAQAKRRELVMPSTTSANQRAPQAWVLRIACHTAHVGRCYARNHAGNGKTQCRSCRTAAAIPVTVPPPAIPEDSCC